MPQVTYKNEILDAREGELVLDVLLRHGHQPAHSCRSGICGSCEMRASSGTISAKATVGIPPTRLATGHFLACQCEVVDDLTLGAGENWSTVSVLERRMLADRVLGLRLSRPDWGYHAGQFVNVRTADGTVRSYSIASTPDDPHLELHVGRVSGGHVSGWLHDEAAVGDTLSLRGPSGSCFYVPGKPEQPMLLIGTGTGLAPLWGIVRTALDAGHSGAITLMHGGRSKANLYLVEEARRLDRQQANFHYRPTLKDGDCPECDAGDLKALRNRHLPSCAGHRVFLCGNPDMVNAMKQDVFLAGADFQDILADPFLRTAAQ